MVILGLLGALFLTRIIGPANYGLYNSVAAIFTYMVTIGKMGVNIYLVRERRDAPLELFHLAFWWLLGYGLLLTIIIGGLMLALGHYWVRTEGFIPVLLTLLGGLPLALVSAVPLALLERELDYRKTALVEIGAQVAFYCAAIPMALTGFGVWAMVAGFWASQLVTVAGFFTASRYRPRHYWNRAELRPMLRYGFSVALSDWVHQLQNLAPSMLLLPLAGSEAVGYVALARRFISMLTFVKETASRLSIPAFARIQDDTTRLLRAIQEVIQLQTLALGALFAAFAAAGLFILPYVLGERWNIPSLLMVFTLMGTRTLIGALFSIHASALMVRKQARLVLNANTVYIILLFLITYIGLVISPPEYRLLVFNCADLLAILPGCWMRHLGVLRHIGRVQYGVTLLWTGGMIAALLAPWLSWWLYLVAAGLLGQPASLRQMREILGMLAQARRGG
ncbi:MAG: lipopolysaccharide biosynthesis protein [Fimbriimonadales bacterium]|nr:MAG: lipopolysaccharide biosynthesis protein [Fimbriimonadales bacterium]